MLRTLLLVSTSGIVYFSKEFVKSVSKPDLLGGVVTAMVDFSVQRTGLPVSYIQLSNVGVAIELNTGARVICALFCDIEDGEEFSKLICSEILHTFTQTYAKELESKTTTVDMFTDFNSAIGGIIRGCVRPVIDQLSTRTNGIQCVLLTDGDSIAYSTQEVENLLMSAHHQALMNSMNDIMASRSDVPASLSLKSKRTTTMLIRIQNASLIVVYKNSLNPKSCNQSISATADLLRQVLTMASNLQDHASR